MKRILELILQLFKYHKLKMLLIVGSSVGFFLLLFPFSDLTDLITAKVMDATNNQVLFQAEKLDIGFFPSLSFSGEDVSVDYGILPTIEAKTLRFAPSVFSLIFAGSQPTSLSFSVDATGLLGGDISVTHKPDGTADDGAKKNKVTVNAESIQLGDALKFTNAPVELQGKATLRTNLDFFPAMDGQPEGEFEMTSKGLKLLAGTVPTDFGPFPIPGINWSQAHIKLHMGSNNLFFDDIALGSPKDPVSGRAKGQMNLRIDKNGPVIGAYEVKIELTVTSAAERDLDTDLALLKGFRQSTSAGGKYLFKVSSMSGSQQPNLGPLPAF